MWRIRIRQCASLQMLKLIVFAEKSLHRSCWQEQKLLLCATFRLYEIHFENKETISPEVFNFFKIWFSSWSFSLIKFLSDLCSNCAFVSLTPVVNYKIILWNIHKSKLEPPFFLQEQFYKKKSADFDKKFKNKLRTKPGLLSHSTRAKYLG